MTRWLFPRLFAAVCFGVLALSAWEYLDAPEAERLFSSHSKACGDRRHLPTGESIFDRDLLEIEIHDSGLNHIVLSGRIDVSRNTFRTQFSDIEGIMLELVPMPDGGPVSLGIQNLIDVPFLNRSELDASKSFQIKIPDSAIPVNGNAQLYPFDTYWVGFEPRLLILHKGRSEYERLRLDAALTDAKMSNIFDVARAPKADSYMNSADRSALPALQNDDDSRQCGFRISRSPWYCSMVACLLMLVLSPAVFSLYKLESDPGLGLISAIIGVASIRAFLLGSSVDWHFYRIDLVFALAVVLVAVIPLWRQSSRKRRRDMLRMKRASIRANSIKRSVGAP